MKLVRGDLPPPARVRLESRRRLPDPYNLEGDPPLGAIGACPTLGDVPDPYFSGSHDGLALQMFPRITGRRV